MDATSDNNTTHGTTLDAHVKSITEMLHDLQTLHKAGKLTSHALYQAMQDEFAYTTRDFPPERSGTITESSTQDLLDGYWQRVQVRKVAAPSGMRSLDDTLNGGFQAKRLVTLLGPPGSGKTSLTNQMAEHVASERPVLYVTSEDVPDVLIAKTLARIGNVKYSAVLYGWAKYEAEINQAIKELRERPSARLLRYLDVTGGVISLDELRERAHAHFEGKAGPGLIIIDYLQRMARVIRETAGVTRDLREAVTNLTEKLRALACELDCCVLAVASMNRASGYNKNSDALAAAKESGDIEYAADVMLSLTEDSSPKRTTASFLAPRILRIDKNRQGVSSTTIELDWDADHQRFLETSKDGR